LQELLTATGMAAPVEDGVLQQLATDFVALADKDGDGNIRWGCSAVATQVGQGVATVKDGGGNIRRGATADGAIG